MDEMLQFVDIAHFTKKRGYGLGVEKYVRKMGYGETAIGHSGANIGTSACMVYLPEHQVSVVVMVNTSWIAYSIAEDLIPCILRDLGVKGRLPYIDPVFIKGFFLWAAAVVAVTVVIRKRKKARASQSNEV